MIELFGFCFLPMILIIHRTIITDFTPLHYFRVFFQPEKSTFFRGSTGVFTCLLTNDRSQSLTELLALFSFFLVIVHSSKLTRWRKKSEVSTAFKCSSYHHHRF